MQDLWELVLRGEFPRFSRRDSDIERARRTYRGKLLSRFAYRLERTLCGKQFFVGDLLSLVDIAVGAQLIQPDFVTVIVDEGRWPFIPQQTLAMKSDLGFVDYPATRRKMLGGVVTEKACLS